MGKEFAKFAGIVGGLAGFLWAFGETGNFLGAAFVGMLVYAFAAWAAKLVWTVLISALSLLLFLARIENFSRMMAPDESPLPQHESSLEPGSCT